MESYLRRVTAAPSPNKDTIFCDFLAPHDPLQPIERADEILAGRLTLQPHTPVDLPPALRWDENPLGDRNWEFQYHSLRWLRPLKIAWDETGDDRYLGRYVALLRSWSESNPREEPSSPLSWNDHATAHRALVYACAAETLPREQWLIDTLKQHGAALADPGFYVGRSNHALNQSLGLLAVGHVTGRPAWVRLAVDRIAALIIDSINEEGVTNEQAVAYQLYNLRAYGQARRYIEACGVGLPDAFARLALMPTFLAHATQPDGRYVTIGDTGVSKAAVLHGTVAEFAATWGERGPKPADRIALYAHAGFLFGRTGWGDDRPFRDELFYSLHFGPARQIHGHHDGTSLTLYGFGRRLLLDTGKYKYVSNKLRDYFVSREAHNVIVTDRQLDPNGATELVYHRSDDHVDVTTVHQKPYHGVEVVRTVAFCRAGRFMVVEDRVASDAATGIRQLWHLGHDALPTIQGAVVTRRARGNVAIYQLADQPNIDIIKGRTGPMQGWVSHRYSEAIPAPAVVGSLHGRRARFLTLLVPFAETQPGISCSQIELDNDHFNVVVEVNGARHAVSSRHV